MPPDSFLCPRHTGALRLSVPTCVKLYQRGTHARPWDTAWLCHGCAIGERHTGEASVQYLHRCAVCGRSDLRLVGSRCLCVSCWNRWRELATRRYRRHRPPGLLDRMRLFVVEVADAS